MKQYLAIYLLDSYNRRIDAVELLQEPKTWDRIYTYNSLISCIENCPEIKIFSIVPRITQNYISYTYKPNEYECTCINGTQFKVDHVMEVIE